MKMVDNIEKAAVLAYHGTDRADFLRFDIGAEFAAFVKAGKKLGDLHRGYEKQEPWKDCVVDIVPGYDSPCQVAKMRFAKKSHSSSR